MAVQLTNWGRSSVSRREVVVQVRSVDETVEIMKNEEKYASPVRGIGSNRSTPGCSISDGGTVVDMTKMYRILDIETDTIAAEAGALCIDIAEQQKNGLPL